MYVTYYALYQSLSLSLSVWRVIFNYETRRGKNDGKYRIFFARRVVKKSNIFSFFFFSKNFARTKRWYNRIDWPMPAGISLSLSFLFFSSTSTISLVLSPREIGSRSNWNESTRDTHPAIFMLVFCLGRPATAKTVSARSNFWTGARRGPHPSPANECTRAIY